MWRWLFFYCSFGNTLGTPLEHPWNTLGDFEEELFPARQCGGGVYFYLLY